VDLEALGPARTVQNVVWMTVAFYGLGVAFLAVDRWLGRR
jgi:hypothetical protein